ncbi:DNA-directed RNA polymerase I subunit RPA49 [Phytophthora pseudosyringae]|uniref:DNA-directed RNA polymerase I subunit RPA49 n=1 Tax=Phytophthora pseudosyringae TaxID=221518 RepID=A0A8T1VH58_9STRA|nr:DNA-directed RNA polymerase I subunit RPA49 [Phytophthora pseudosyringae]
MSKRVKVHLQHQEAFDSTAPVVATFRNGPPPPSQRKDLAFEVFENPAKKQRLVVASSEKVAYQGANFGYLGSSHDFAHYAVGVYDRKTKEVRLCNVNQIYVMQQAIKNSAENVDDNRGEDKSFMEQRRDLVEVFGSKKSKRMQKNREENIVDLEHISGAASVSQTLQKKISAAKRKLEEERAQDGSYTKEGAALAATRNALLPPCDVDAPTPDRVYDLTKFMDHAVMDSLTIMAEEVIEALQTSSVAEYAASLSLASLPTRLMLSLSAPYDVNKMCLVVYLAYMIDFYNSRFPMRKSAAVFSEEKGIPLVVVRHFLKLFTDISEGNGYPTYFQSKAMKDKLSLFIIVVALTVNGFTLDLTEVGNDLKRSSVHIQSYARQLGCIVEKTKPDAAIYGGASSLASKKQIYRAVLSVPLHFPRPKRGGPARR